MTAAEIAEVLRMALSTVSAVLKRIGLGKRSRLSPPEPANRYERKRPGELVHLDIKKLGRISIRGAGHRVSGHRGSQFRVGPKRLGATGWEFVHVAVDDATRLTYAEVLSDERAVSAIRFLRRAVTWFASFGITVERVLSDNGARYRSGAHALALAELGIRHLFPPALSPTHQWQRGALHPDAHPSLGLRSDLRQLSRAQRSTIELANPLQLHTTTQLAQPQAPRNTPTRADQRAWKLHLVVRLRCRASVRVRAEAQLRSAPGAYERKCARRLSYTTRAPAHHARHLAFPPRPDVQRIKTNPASDHH
jgi:hypothetical protein